MEPTENIWLEGDFCKRYLKNIRISTTDIHYGYLSPGERELGLLGKPLNLRGKWIVEIGCGTAQNCIALTKWGAKCTGIDISDIMLQIGRSLSEKEKVDIELIHGDARELGKLLGKSRYGYKKAFIFISTFAISFFCHDEVELVDFFDQVRKNIDPNGLFVFCFSHPSQKPKNRVKDYGWREKYFTIAETTQALDSTGFVVERRVSQTTKNPSKMLSEQKKRFPYEVFGLDSRLDRLTNKPHTIIYVARPK